MQALLRKSECRLLNYSVSVKNNESFQFLLPLLEKDKRILPDNEFLSLEELVLLGAQKDDLIKVCTNEWEAVSNIPKINKEKNIKCDLCGRPDLVELFDIKNSITGKVITIGGTCINKFSTIKKADRLVNNDKELLRYNDLLLIIPNLKEIYYQGDFINSTKYVLPTSLIDRFKSIEKQLKSYIRKYIKKGETHAKDYISDHNLLELLTEFKDVKNVISAFPNQADKFNFLPKTHAFEIERLQKNGEKIIASIQKNQGVVSSLTAQKITTINFLEKFTNKIDSKVHPIASIYKIEQGKFIFSIPYNKKVILASVPSQLCLKEIVYSNNENFDFKLFFTKNSDQFSVHDNNSIQSLNDIATDILLNSFQDRRYYPTPNEIVDSIKKYTTQIRNNSNKHIHDTLSELVSNDYLFANDEKTLIRRSVKEIKQFTSENLYYNEQLKIMQTFLPTNLSRDKWKILSLVPKIYTKKESEKILKKINSILADINIFKKLNEDEFIDIPTSDLLYIAKSNLFHENINLINSKMVIYESNPITINDLLSRIIVLVDK